jgi:hypothetical protein
MYVLKDMDLSHRPAIEHVQNAMQTALTCAMYKELENVMPSATLVTR